jgi:chlorophyllide a reductase subunit Z
MYREMTWSEDAKTELDRLVARKPVLVRISAAKNLRDAAEQAARAAGAECVSLELLRSAATATGYDRAAA